MSYDQRYFNPVSLCYNSNNESTDVKSLQRCERRFISYLYINFYGFFYFLLKTRFFILARGCSFITSGKCRVSRAIILGKRVKQERGSTNYIYREASRGYKSAYSGKSGIYRSSVTIFRKRCGRQENSFNVYFCLVSRGSCTSGGAFMKYGT